MTPNEHALQAADQLRNDRFQHPAIFSHALLAGPVVIGLDRRAQDWRLRFERVDLVERAQDGKHDVTVVHRVGDRLRKALA